MTTETKVKRLYHIDEGGCVDHWIVATSEEEALEIGRDIYMVGDNDPADEITVKPVPDDKVFRVSCPDDDPEPGQVPPGGQAESMGLRPHEIPRIVATAAQWAGHYSVGDMIACSEF